MRLPLRLRHVAETEDPVNRVRSALSYPARKVVLAVGSGLRVAADRDPATRAMRIQGQT
jgi:hypothetical protein